MTDVWRHVEGDGRPYRPEGYCAGCGGLTPFPCDAEKMRVLSESPALGLALWAEFGWAQPNEDSSRAPRPLPPDDPYWSAAAARVRTHLRQAASATSPQTPDVDA